VDGSPAEVVRASITAFNSRDLDGLLGVLDENVELAPFAAKLNGEVYIGPEGVRRWLREIDDEWSEWQVEIGEQRLVEEVVLSIGRIVARGRDTDVAVEMPAAFIARVRSGRVTRLESFGTEAEALAYAGTA
jgi:ketosteroid isomerase-like protein